MTLLIVAFRSFANAPKKQYSIAQSVLVSAAWRHRMEVGYTGLFSVAARRTPVNCLQSAAVVRFRPQTMKKNIYIMNTIEGIQ